MDSNVDLFLRHHQGKGVQNIEDGMVADTRRKITRLQVKPVAGPAQMVQERFPFEVGQCLIREQEAQYFSLAVNSSSLWLYNCCKFEAYCR